MVRFWWALDVCWDRATRVEAGDFCRWLQVAGRPVRLHWREQGEPEVTPSGRPGGAHRPYAVSVRAHSETVLRSFYGFRLDAGTGPLLNPFPLDRARRGRRAHAHRNPMDPARHERIGLYRPTVPSRVPRSVSDEQFNEIFARLGSHRDRALVAFYVSTGARASELLSTTQGGVDPGRGLITVVRKRSREIQELGLGHGRGPAIHRSAHRGTPRDHPPQPGAIPPAQHRRTRPPAPNRTV
ncbi:MAG: hypothetical protein ACRDRO_19585 [Pseudonocardiaceae bacterium]